MRSGTGRIAAISTALAVASLLVFAGTARAGTYRVAQCGWGIGAELTPVPVADSRGFLVNPAFCVPPPGVEPQGLRLEAATGLDDDAGVARARWVMPPGTVLSAVKLAWAGALQPGFEATLGADVGFDFRPLVSASGSNAYGPVTTDVSGPAWAFEAQLSCGGGPVVDCSRQRSSWLLLSALTLTVLDPTAPVTRASGPLIAGGWQRGTAALQVDAEDIGSGLDRLEATVDGNPVLEAPQPCAVLPIEGEVRAARMRPCPVSATQAVEVDTTKLGDGAHTVRVCAVDFGGTAGCAPDARVEVDNSAPTIIFAGAREGSVAATVGDRLSGPVAGTISVRRVDAGAWTPLPTTFAAGTPGTATLTAHLPEMDAGTWYLRAEASDAIGNAGAAELKVAGSAAELRRLVAAGGRGARGRAPGAHRKGRTPPPTRHGGRPTHLSAELYGTSREAHPRTASATSALTIGFGSAVELRGRLTGRGGAGVEGRSLVVVSRFAHGARPRRTVHRTRTGSGGRFELRLPSGPSRRVVVVFPGGAGLASSRSDPLPLRVGASVSLEASPRRLANGESIALTGRVSPGSARIPRRGKVVTIQYLERATHRWRPALVVRSDSRGAFKTRYRFRYVTGEARIRLRATALPEAGWPYAEGSSRPVTVVVNG